MTPDLIFSFVNLLALGGWVLLILMPSHRLTTALSGGVIPAVLSAAYLILIAGQWHSSAGGFSSLDDVARLFSNPWLLLAGWIHYLAFDLLIGWWEVRDAKAREIPRLAVAPTLVFTFLFGPIGWLGYLALRSRWRRS
jgi:hypothetical protein